MEINQYKSNKALDGGGGVGKHATLFDVSLQADVKHDKLMPHSGSNPRDPLERQKVKIAHAQWARSERERCRLGVGVGVQRAVNMYRRTARAGAARGDGKVLRVGRAPSETVGALGERSSAQLRLATVKLGEIPEGEAGAVHSANATRAGERVHTHTKKKKKKKKTVTRGQR